MLYLAIPAHNEVATIGVLLWRLRTVLAEFPREYEVVVYDDASTDETADVAEQYVHAMPVTVLRGTVPIGYAGAVNALVRYIAAHTRYPRRDAMLLLQGDFTDPPGIVPEFARRFEGGADVVVGERTAVVDAPRPVRRLFAAAGWALRPFVKVEGVRDLTSSMRLMRISALRDLLRAVGDDAVCEGDSWTANADLLLRLVPHARRVETVPVEPTYGVRTRETRRVTVRDALAALRWAWRARGRRAVTTSVPESASDSSAKGVRPAATGRRRDEPEVTADRLRERSRERERLRGDGEPKPTGRNGRPARDSDGGRSAHTEEQKAQRRQELRDDPREPQRSEPETSLATSDTSARQPKPERPPRPPRPPRPERLPRSQRSPRGGRTAPVDINAERVLDDPFAGPTARSAFTPVTDTTIPADPSVAPTRELINTPPSGVVPPATTSADEPGASDELEAIESESESNDEHMPDGDDASASGVEGSERKRRRNRRSRRRKSRPRSEGSSEITDGANTTSSSTSPAAAAGVGSPYADEHDTDDSAEHDHLGMDDATDGAPDDAADDSSESSNASRAKRRGRRGRRGGSRRSRGRGRDGSAGADGDSASPTPPTSDSE